MKMLILQKDYIIVELYKNIGVRGSVDGEPKNDGKIHGLGFTIQCNGKLKKHITQFRTKLTTIETEVIRDEKQEIQDYSLVYGVLELLNNLGYSIDIDSLIRELELEVQ